MAESIAALEAIDLLYRAAVDPKLWPEALQKLAFCAGGLGTAMIRITPGSKDGLVVSPELEEANVEYQREWWRHDSRVLRIYSRNLSQGVCCEAQLFSRDEIAHDPLRQEFLRPYGIGAFAAHLVAPLPNLVVAFSVQRALNRGEFERHELATLDLLGRHAARALVISMRLSATAQLERALTSTLGQVDCAAFLVDRNLRVVLANGPAERLLGDGLTMRGGCLQASSRDDQAALKRLMRSVLQKSAQLKDLGAIALPRPSGRRGLLLQAIPISSEGSQPGLAASEAMIIVIDPEQQEGYAPVTELCLLGLTHAEAKIAALLGSGHSRAEAAEQLGISEWTVADTAKKIYSKLGISRQSALVRLVDRLSQLGKRR